MEKNITADEAIEWCMTVGELITELSKLPPEARLVKFAGGDADGYVAVRPREFKVVTAGVRDDLNDYFYGGPFEVIGGLGYRKGTKFLKKFKAVEL